MHLLKATILLFLGILYIVHICEAGRSHNYHRGVLLKRCTHTGERLGYYCGPNEGPFLREEEAFRKCVKKDDDLYGCRYPKGKK